MKKARKLLGVTAALLITGLVTVFICNYIISQSAEGLLFDDHGRIPYRKVGLLLGTTRLTENGRMNPYYYYRIQAAAALWRAGKVRYIIASGDNGSKGYNEPADMRHDLIREGVDSADIYLDHAGFRTFDSMVRLREIFGQDSVTVISQKFHNERAVYIGKQEDIHAIGFNAEDVDRRSGFRVNAREKLARVKVFADYLLGKEPRFGGPKVHIP